VAVHVRTGAHLRKSQKFTPLALARVRAMLTIAALPALTSGEC
jgi:predicted ThiF/HesA family dinucleotide-utilizing enzyme